MTKYTIKIEGMSCPMCEAHISEVIRKTLPHAKKVSASYKKKEATFLSDEAVDTELLRRAINETGYTFLSSDSKPYVKKRFG